ELHKHFRKFLLVKTEDEQELYFRFYDPRVLRIFLPTCDQGQIREFFGAVDYFLMEDEDPEFAIRYWHENGILRTKQYRKQDLFINTDDAVSKFQIPEKTSSHIEVNTTTAPSSEKTDKPDKPKSKWNMFD
ncbi:MAG TPA: DUF4123 domain-containing protein, partial [Flavipsychrobacter sp.]|nr:DUF4123 domain-containing protein [Flavipsychrobacter sp.]